MDDPLYEGSNIFVKFTVENTFFNEFCLVGT